MVQPMSNLIASEQIRAGDLLRVDYQEDSESLCFRREAEGLPVHEMAAFAGTSSLLALSRSAGAPSPEPVRATSPRTGRRGLA
jgi:hypothetical protein